MMRVFEEFIFNLVFKLPNFYDVYYLLHLLARNLMFLKNKCKFLII